MKKESVIFISFSVCILTLLTTMALTIGVAWKLTVTNELTILQKLADTTLNRTTRAFKSANEVLRTLSTLSVSPCSVKHIEVMRTAILEHPVLEEVGYFRNDLLSCSSWGRIEMPILREPAVFLTTNGLHISTNVSSPLTKNSARIALHLGAYNVLINPDLLFDPLTNQDIQLTIASKTGVILSALHHPDIQRIKSLAMDPSGMANDDRLTVVLRSDDFIFISSESTSKLVRKVFQQQMPILLLGLLCAIGFIIIIVWYTHKKLSPLNQLALAVEKKQFVVHYQPIVDLTTGHCVGAEALVRWQREDGTMVSPDVFIPLAEHSGLILPITDQVIHQVVTEMGDILAHQHDLHIAINVCAQDIKTGRILDVLTEALNLKGIKSDQIWIEATERGLMDIASAKQVIEKARNLGYRVSIDDFGTGYSSLSHLQGLPLDTLKIDKSFVDTIKSTYEGNNITDHIIAMAHSLHLAIVAEGIETPEQAAYLHALGVDYGQGWLFSKPLCADDFLVYCKKNLHQSPALSATPLPL